MRTSNILGVYNFATEKDHVGVRDCCMVVKYFPNLLINWMGFRTVALIPLKKGPENGICINGKEISDVTFRTDKEGHLWR